MSSSARRKANSINFLCKLFLLSTTVIKLLRPKKCQIFVIREKCQQLKVQSWALQNQKGIIVTDDLIILWQIFCISNLHLFKTVITLKESLCVNDSPLFYWNGAFSNLSFDILKPIEIKYCKYHHLEWISFLTHIQTKHSNGLNIVSIFVKEAYFKAVN